MLPKIVCLGVLFSMLSTFTASTTVAQSLSDTPREEKLLNGLKVLLFDDQSGEKVSMRLRVHAGSAFDPQGKEGLMKLLAANIFPNPEIKEYYTDELGGSLAVESNYDFIQINASVRSDQLLTMLESISNALTNITIDKDTTAKLKTAQLKKIDELSKNASYVADQAAAARLFGSFPYGRPEDGTAASVQKIDFADLLQAKQRFLTADNATVVLSGKYDESLALRAIKRYLGAWLKADKPTPSTFRQPDDPDTAVQTLSSSAADREERRFAARGITRGFPDSAAYAMVANVLETRLKKSADSDVRNEEHVLPGMFIISVNGTNGQNDTLKQLFTSSITDQEFQSAKAAVTAEREKRNIGDRWLDVDTFKADPPAKDEARATATSLADVQRIFAKLQKQPFASVVVSPSKASN
jgi:zinc protease